MPLINSTNAGRVSGLWGGTAILRTADGKLRVLKLGDLVHMGDAIMTTQDGIVQITTGDGEARVADAQPVLAPLDAATPDALLAAAPAAPASDLEVLGPTAAGLTGGDGGNLGPGLRVDRISEGVTGASLAPSGTVDQPTFTEPDSTTRDTGALRESPTPQAGNQPPEPVSDVARTPEDTAVRGSVIANDADPDGDALTVIRVQVGTTVVDVPADGNATLVLTEGTLVIGADGQYVFTPAEGFHGPVPAIDVTVSDGTQTAESTLTITVDSVNDAPVAPPDAAIVPEDTVATGNVLANDRDFDGDTLTVTGFEVGGIAHAAGSAATLDGIGTLVIRADGSYTFTPAPDYDGPVPVATYTVSDGQASVTSTLTITVTPTFDPPVAARDTLVVDEDSGPTIGNVLTNDRDPDGDALQVTGFSFGGTQYAAGETAAVDGVGWLRIDADGRYEFSPYPDYTGPVPSASYTVSDGRFTANAALDIRIVPIHDDPPQAADDGVSTPEDTAITIDPATLTANDTDRDGDVLTVVSVQDAVHGSVELVGGQIVFTPDPDYSGPARFTYTVTDPSGLSSTATVNVQVTPLNDPPAAAADTATGPEDGGPIAGSVLANDNDPDGDGLQVTQFVVGGTVYAAGTTATLAGVGTLVVQADGTFTFTPAADFNGAVPTATVTVTDGTVAVSAPLDITVTPVNDAPLALDDAATLPEDGSASGNVLVNDADSDGDALAVTQFTVGGATYAAGATAVLAGVGTLVIEADGRYTFTPAADFNGAVPPVRYTVSDGTATSTAALTIDVGAVNDAPLARPDVATTPEDLPAVGNVLANDGDADGDALSVISFNVGGTIYAAGSTAVIAGVGTLVLQADGAYTFTPLADYAGPVPAVGYTVSDGTATVNSTLTLAITPVNDAPTALPDVRTVAEDSAGNTGNVLTNDDDADGDALVVTGFMVGGTGHAAGDTAVLPGIGTITLAADGGYVFTPAADFNGPVPVITYTVSDGQATSTATLTLTVSASNDGPVAQPDGAVIAEDGVASGNVLVNDTDADGDPLVVTQFTVAGQTVTAGTTVALVGVGDVVVQANGDWTFTPVPDFNGNVPEITYTVSDGSATGTSTLNVTVTAANDAPSAHPDTAVVAEDSGAAVGNVLTNDGDADGDPLVVTGFSVGGVDYAPGATAALAGVGTLTIGADGQWRFQPAADYNGPVPAASYTVTDGSSTSNSTLSITVTPVPDAPAASDDTGSGLEDGAPVIGNVLANDADADGDALVVTQFSVGGAVYAAGDTAVIAGVGTLVVDADGRYTFTPAADFNGSVPNVVYTASDGTSTSTASLTIDIAAVNDAPLPTADHASIDEDSGPATGNVLGNDHDVDGDALAVTQFVVDGVVHAAGDTATIAGVGTLVVRADGSYVFTPSPGYNGDMPTATVTVSDGQASATSTLDVTVNAVNDAPVVRPDSATGLEDGAPVSGNVLVNDGDPDGDALAITQFSVGGTDYAAGTTAVIAGVGSVRIDADGHYVFTPVADFNGPVPPIGYTASDGTASSTSALSITISPANDAPVARDDVATLDEDQPSASGNVLANDSDADGDALTVTQFTVNGSTYAAGSTAAIAGVGVLVIGAQGSYAFTPEADYSGPVPTVTYTVTDGTVTTTAHLDLTVRPENDAPVVQPDRQVLPEDTVATGNVLANDRDPDGDALAITRFDVDGASYAPGDTAVLAGIGRLTLQADGAYRFEPEPDYAGPVPTVSYFVSDGTLTSSSTLDLEVGGLNDAPVAVTDSQTVAEDHAAQGNVLDNDHDADGDALSVTGYSIAGQTHAAGETAVIAGVGEFTMQADGSYRFVPAPNFNGAVPTLTYTVSDGTTTATSTLAVNVTAVNDPPDAIDDGSVALSGLLGEYHAFAENVDGPSLAGLAQAIAWADADSVDATFSATTLAYGLVSGDLGGDGHLQTFLGSDAPSLSRDPQDSSDAVVRMSGELTLVAGTYNFRVLSDDGYSIRIDGVVVAQYTDNQSPTTRTHASFTIAEGGTHAIEIVYWDQGGQAVFRPELSRDGGASYQGLGGFGLVHSTYSTREDQALTIDPARLLANDADPDGDPLTIVSVQDATHGSVSLVGGQVVFTPDADYHGPASFTYTISDGHGGLDTATVHLSVTSVNDAPVARADAPSGLVEDGGPYTGNVLANDQDPDGTALTVTQFTVGGTTYAAGSTATLAGVGTIVVGGNGAYTFNPAPDYNGTVPVITYTASDGLSTATSTLTLALAALNDAPVNALPASFAGVEDTALRLTGLAVNDVDAGSAPLTLTLSVASGVLTAASGAGVTVDGSGSDTITLTGTQAAINAYLASSTSQPVFQPPANFSGAVGLTMSSSDSSKLDQDASTIQVAAVADAPNLVTAIKHYGVSTGFEEGTGGSLGGISSGVWHTHNSSGTVEIGAQGVYQGGGSTNRVLELERSAGDASDLYTDITTRAGEVYSLDLSFMARNGATGNSVVNILWDGELIGRLDSTSTTLTNTNFWFIATTTGTSRLTFVAEDSNSTGGLLDNIGLQIKEHAGMQGYQVNLSSIAATLADTDGSETLRIEVGSIPSGMLLADGSGGHVSTAGAATVDVTGWNLDELVIVPGSGYANGTNFNLTVTATSTESSNGDHASTTASVPITVLSDVNDLVGTDTGNDVRTGTGTADMMWGLGGDDVINGANGNDTLLGNAGNDTLDGGNGADRISGGRGNDALVGGQSSDVLYGGSGNDTMTGGTAGSTPATTTSVSDVFAWHFGDAGSAGAPARDVINDFKYASVSSGGDVLDLRDLLQGETGSNLTSYLHFSYDSSSGSTTISVSTTGGFSGGFSSSSVDQEITLAGVNLTTIGSDAQIISDLITKKQLNVDGA